LKHIIIAHTTSLEQMHSTWQDKSTPLYSNSTILMQPDFHDISRATISGCIASWGKLFWEQLGCQITRKPPLTSDRGM